MNMRANFIMINFMVAELSIGQMGINMRGIGLMISSNEKEILSENGINMGEFNND